jgi:hypothetical protein
MFVGRTGGAGQGGVGQGLVRDILQELQRQELPRHELPRHELQRGPTAGDNGLVWRKEGARGWDDNAVGPDNTETLLSQVCVGGGVGGWGGAGGEWDLLVGVLFFFFVCA